MYSLLLSILIFFIIYLFFKNIFLSLGIALFLYFIILTIIPNLIFKTQHIENDGNTYNKKEVLDKTIY